MRLSILLDSAPVSSFTRLTSWKTLCFDFAYSSRSDYSRSALSKLFSIIFLVGYISVGSIDDAGCLCCLPCRSSVRRAKRQKNSTHSFIKTPNGVLTCSTSLSCVFRESVGLHFVFASSSLFVPRQKLLPLLRDFVSAKFPNGREKRRFTNRGRRILPTRADSRLKRIGQKSNSAKKALVTFSPASYGSLREVSPVKRDAPSPLRNIDPDDPPRFGEAFAPTTGGFA